MPRWPAMRRAARATLPRRMRSAPCGHLGQRQMVGGAGHQRGGAEGGAGRGGQRRAVPADHRDPVGHRRQSPGVSQVAAGRAGQPAGRAPVRVPGRRRSAGGGAVGTGGRVRSVPVGERREAVASASCSPAPSRSSGSRLQTMRSVRMSVQVPSSVADARYPGVAQHALADAADLLGDLLGGGVVGGRAQLDALELLVAEQPLGGGERGLGGVALAARPGGDDVATARWSGCASWCWRAGRCRPGAG